MVLFFAAGNGDVTGPVGGDQQCQDPAQRGEGDQQAHERGGGPEPRSVLAGVSADAVGEQDARGKGGAEPAKGCGHAGGARKQGQQAEQGQGDAVGAVGVHQRLRDVTRTLRRGGRYRSRSSRRLRSAWVTGCLSASAAARPRAADFAATRARRRRTVTAALVIPSIPVAARAAFRPGRYGSVPRLWHRRRRAAAGG